MTTPDLMAALRDSLDQAKAARAERESAPGWRCPGCCRYVAAEDAGCGGRCWKCLGHESADAMRVWHIDVGR